MSARPLSPTLETGMGETVGRARAACDAETWCPLWRLALWRPALWRPPLECPDLSEQVVRQPRTPLLSPLSDFVLQGKQAEEALGTRSGQWLALASHAAMNRPGEAFLALLPTCLYQFPWSISW